MPLRLNRSGFHCGLIALLAIVATASPGVADDAAPGVKPLRVLILGNSQIYYNDLPATIEALSESAPADRPRIKTGRYVAGGASLQSLWEAGEEAGKPRALIASEKWDFVVIQEHYQFYTKPDSFTKYARLFDELIRKNGSKTLLYCTASIDSLYPDGFLKLYDMELALAKELKVPIAPAGKAWLQLWGASPTPEQRLALYHADKAHPGQKGSYLNACVLYAFITGSSPVGLTNRIPKQPEETVTAAEAKQYQEAAWKVYQELNSK